MASPMASVLDWGDIIPLSIMGRTNMDRRCAKSSKKLVAQHQHIYMSKDLLAIKKSDSCVNIPAAAAIWAIK